MKHFLHTTKILHVFLKFKNNRISDKIEEKSPTVRSEALWLLLSQASSAGGNIFCTILLAVGLGPEKYGLIVVPILLSTIVSQTVCGSIGTALMSSIPLFEKEKNTHELKKLLTILLTISPILCLFLFSLIYFVLSKNINFTYLIILSIYTITNSCNIIFTFYLVSSFKRKLSSIGILIDSNIKLLLIFALQNFNVLNDFNALVTFSLSSLLCLAFYLIRGDHDFVIGRVRRSSLYAVLTVAGPSLIWGIFTATHAASDRWAMSTFGTATETGQYNLALQISYSVVVFGASFITSSYAPFLYRDFSLGEYDQRSAWVYRTSLISKYIVALGLGVAIIVAAVEVSDFSILPSAYTVQHGVIPMLIVAGAFFAAGQSWGIVLQGDRCIKRLTGIKCACASLGIVLNVVSAMHFGIIGLAVAMMLTTAIYFMVIRSAAQGNPVKT